MRLGRAVSTCGAGHDTDARLSRPERFSALPIGTSTYPGLPAGHTPAAPAIRLSLRLHKPCLRRALGRSASPRGASTVVIAWLKQRPFPGRPSEVLLPSGAVE